MRWRMTACSVPLAVLAMGLVAGDAFAAPLMQPALGQGVATFQRVDAQRPSSNSLKHCLTGKGASSCRSAAKPDQNARAPQLPDHPGGGTGAAAATDTLPLPSHPPPSAGVRGRVDRHSGEPQANGPSPGFKFTGGMGVPTNRATLEGALSPYQQPNGNTGASQSGKLTNGLENEGMHFGLEYHY